MKDINIKGDKWTWDTGADYNDINSTNPNKPAACYLDFLIAFRHTGFFNENTQQYFDTKYNGMRYTTTFTAKTRATHDYYLKFDQADGTGYCYHFHFVIT